jgi:hypothetical protein
MGDSPIRERYNALLHRNPAAIAADIVQSERKLMHSRTLAS